MCRYCELSIEEIEGMSEDEKQSNCISGFINSDDDKTFFVFCNGIETHSNSSFAYNNPVWRYCPICGRDLRKVENENRWSEVENNLIAPINKKYFLIINSVDTDVESADTIEEAKEVAKEILIENPEATCYIVEYNASDPIKCTIERIIHFE